MFCDQRLVRIGIAIFLQVLIVRRAFRRFAYMLCKRRYQFFPKLVKLRPNGSQNAQQIIQNEPADTSGDRLETDRFQDREKVGAPDIC